MKKTKTVSFDITLVEDDTYGGYTAFCDDIPGIVAEGDDEEDAINQFGEALRVICEYKKPAEKPEIDTTQRGFGIYKFTDNYGEKCSIQKSSSAMEDRIWLGIDDPKLTVFENEDMGKYLVVDMPKNFSVSTRMHLNRNQVRELLPLLDNFVETGDL